MNQCQRILRTSVQKKRCLAIRREFKLISPPVVRDRSAGRGRHFTDPNTCFNSICRRVAGGERLFERFVELRVDFSGTMGHVCLDAATTPQDPSNPPDEAARRPRRVPYAALSAVTSVMWNARGRRLRPIGDCRRDCDRSRTCRTGHRSRAYSAARTDCHLSRSDSADCRGSGS